MQKLTRHLLTLNRTCFLRSACMPITQMLYIKPLTPFSSAPKNEDPVKYNFDADQIKGTTRGRGGLMLMAFTCSKCETKQAKTFSKESYEHGVVLLRCDGCENLHLIADNLGWFRDNKVNI